MTAQHQQPTYDARIGVLENDVAGIKTGISMIMQKLDTRDRVPWGVIGTFAGLVLTVIASIGGLAFRPLGDGITDLKTALIKIESRSDRYVPREDLDNRFVVAAQRRDDFQRITDARVERIERDMDGMQKQVVPRGEHEQQWLAQRARDEAMQRQIDQARQELGGLSTPRDAMQALQRRLDEIERSRRPTG